MHQTKPGLVAKVRKVDRAAQQHEIATLIGTSDLRIEQILIPAGQTIPTYEAAGQVVIHCLEGRIALTALETKRELGAGDVLYLTINEPFSTEGLEDSSLLVTMILPRSGPRIELIG
jgi:quercetin dioxygenase-like cupin family protein